MNEMNKDGLYIMKNGKIEVVKPPESGYGKQTIYWENNNPTRVETTESIIIK